MGIGSVLVTAGMGAQRWMDDGHMDGWGWWMMGIGMLVVLVLVVALVFLLVREAGRGSSRGNRGALDTLDHRFARGDIDEDEYRSRRDILSG